MPPVDLASVLASGTLARTIEQAHMGSGHVCARGQGGRLRGRRGSLPARWPRLPWGGPLAPACFYVAT